MSGGPAGPRPAFYALRPGGVRDYVTLLHAPYTAWNLGYVAIGAALAPVWRPERLVWLLAAFFLAVGVGAHALDELHGRPLRTRIPDGVLVGMAAGSLAGAAAIGVAAAIAWGLWLLAFVAAGVLLVVAYNLELLGGRLHSDLWFALAWGAFPFLTAYAACAGEIRAEALLGAAAAAFLSHAQRALSTPARRLRRTVSSVDGELTLADGTREPLTREVLLAGTETALRALTAAVVLLAIALVVLRCTS